MGSPEVPETGLPGGPIAPGRPRYRRTGLIATTAAVALLAAACGAGEEASSTAADDAGSGETASGETAGVVLDPSLFSGEAMTVSGDVFDPGSLAEKDLVLWFWAPW